MIFLGYSAPAFNQGIFVSRLVISHTALLCVAVSVGCAKSSRPAIPRFPVRGTVTLDGKPLSDGQVSFITVASGLSDVMTVKEGTFAGEAAAGERRVEFSRVISKAPSGPPMPGVTAEVPQESLPAKFNSESRFTATVSPDGSNHFTFDLKSRQ